MGKTLWLVVLLAGCVPEYPEEVRSNFMKECTLGGDLSSAVCHCMLRGLEKRYELGEYLRIERDMIDGVAKPPDGFREIAFSCAAKGD